MLGMMGGGSLRIIYYWYRIAKSGGLGALAIWVPCPDFFCIRQTPLVSGIYLDLWMSIEATSMLSQGAPRFYVFFFSR